MMREGRGKGGGGGWKGERIELISIEDLSTSVPELLDLQKVSS